MWFEDVEFNTDLIKGLTLEQFLVHRQYNALWPSMKKEDRKKRLEELWKLVNGKPK